MKQPPLGGCFGCGVDLLAFNMSSKSRLMLLSEHTAYEISLKNKT